MPTIVVKDPTLLSRLDKYKQNPADAAYDDALYTLLQKVENSKPALRGLDNLPQLVVQEVMRALDGKLVEALKAALLPAIGNVVLEIPVELSVKVRLRLEPILELSSESNNYNVSTPGNHNGSPTSELSNNNNGGGEDTKKSADLDELERKAIELLREHGGCWEGSAYSLARFIVGGDVNWALESRLRRRLVRRDGRLCLPSAAASATVAQQ